MRHLSHDEPVVARCRSARYSEDDNVHAAQRGEHMIINPDRFSPTQNIAASIHGHIGDMDKGFADADVIIERTL